MTRKKAGLIIANAAEVITCASGGRPKKGRDMLEIGRFENASLAIVDGLVAAVGAASEVEAAYESGIYIDATGKSIIPGIVEPHTHLVYGGSRLAEFEMRIKGAGYLEILEAGGGILSTVEKTREAPEQELFQASMHRLDRLLANGVTVCEIKTGYGLEKESELKMLRVILDLGRRHSVDVVPTFLPAHAIPGDWKGKEDEFTDVICREMIPAAADLLGLDAGEGLDDRRPKAFIDVFCEKGAFDLAQCERVIREAKKHGFAVKAHVDEFTNLGGSAFAIREGAVSIDHLDMINEQEIGLLAKSETIGIVTPTVNFNLGSREFAPARKMIDSGCAVALSTDYNPGSSPCPSPAIAMAIAARYQKLLPAEAINAVTINSAAAVAASKYFGWPKMPAARAIESIISAFQLTRILSSLPGRTR